MLAFIKTAPRLFTMLLHSGLNESVLLPREAGMRESTGAILAKIIPLHATSSVKITQKKVT